jgi:hypothetical protein
MMCMFGNTKLQQRTLATHISPSTHNSTEVGCTYSFQCVCGAIARHSSMHGRSNSTCHVTSSLGKLAQQLILQLQP